jgi:hypothetical protein
MTTPLSETKLIKQSRHCYCCGVFGKHKYHFISDHLHNDRIKMTKISVLMDNDCKCGCCESFQQCEADYEPKVENMVYYQSICNYCNIFELQENITNEWCVGCSLFSKCNGCLFKPRDQKVTSSVIQKLRKKYNKKSKHKIEIDELRKFVSLTTRTSPNNSCDQIMNMNDQYGRFSCLLDCE